MKNNYISINGKIEKEKDAKISVLDHGLLVGDGVFETLRTYNGKLFKFDEHYRRLKSSATQIFLPLKISKNSLKQQILKLIKKNKINEARVRITITRGIGPQGLSINCIKQSIIIIAHELIQHDYSQGVKVITYELERNLPTVKSLSYLPSVIAKHQATKKKAFETLFKDKKGYIREGSFSNYFIIKKKTVFSPTENILKGITRNIAIKIIKKNNLKFLEKNLTTQNILNADELFLTFTTGGIVPIIKVNNKYKKIGPTTNKLLRDYKDYISRI